MKLSNLFIFAAGAAIGSLVTWKLIEHKYREIANEEIASVKEVYKMSQQECESVEEDDEPELDQEEYKQLVECYSKDMKENKKKEPEYFDDEPYVIKPEVFGEYEDYEKIGMLYFADGFLTDDNEVLVDDVEGQIGWESLDTFGEFEEDAVYVRNDRLKTDYEIIRDLRNYKDLAR